MSLNQGEAYYRAWLDMGRPLIAGEPRLALFADSRCALGKVLGEPGLVLEGSLEMKRLT